MLKTPFGAQVRNDWINNGLYQTEDRVRVDKLDSGDRYCRFARNDTKPIDFTDNLW